jgi:hypothetical protein
VLVPSPAHPAAKAHAQTSLAAATTLSAHSIEVPPVGHTLIGFNPDPVTEIFLDLIFEHPEASATNRYRARFV